MRKLFAVAAIAASMSFSATADAQITTVLTIGSDVVAGSNAYGFQTTSSVTLRDAGGISSFIAYCFDDKRGAQSGTTYLALTFDQFVNNVGVVGAGGRAANWDDVNKQDLNSMAALIMSYGANGTANNTTQQNIWNIGNGVTNGTSVVDYSSSWMVLVDKNEWEQGKNANQSCDWRGCTPRFQGSQSLLANIPVSTVPEPSTYALMAAGLAGLGFAARRRRQTVA